MSKTQRTLKQRLGYGAGILLATLCMSALVPAQPVQAEGPREVLQTAERLAIQHNGRVKPLDSFAIEVVRELTGAARIDGQSPIEVLLSMVADPVEWQAKPVLSVPFLPLREELGIDPKAKRVSYDSLLETRKLMQLLPPIVDKQRRDVKLTMFENEVLDLYSRFAMFASLTEDSLAIVPPAQSNETSWTTIRELNGYSEEKQMALSASWAEWKTALKAASAEGLLSSTQKLRELLHSLNPSAYPPAWRVDLEILYNHSKPFHLAQLAYGFAVLFFFLGVLKPSGRFFKLGMSALTIGFLLHLAGIVIRVVLGGRPPVSNFYETMLWIPFVAVLMALIFEWIYKSNYFGLSSGVLAILVLVLADYLPVDPAISPVVAVLRSHLWLTIHVLTIVASYGALALAVVLAHVYCAVYLARPGDALQLKKLNLMIYRNLQVGVVLLAAGIILGGVWANASWGRFWGWDPKETWALITLLWYLAILHGRFAGWIKGVGLSLTSIAGFFLLLMTYYGVSFYLVGLHSYAGANAKPLPPLLIGYLVAELLFMAVVGFAAYKRKAAIR